MSHPESGHPATDESHLRLELNERLSVHGATVTNLKEDLQDGVLLLALPNQARIEEAGSFNKCKEGKTLSEYHGRENRMTLCKILNKHGKSHGFHSNFRESDVLSENAPEAVRLVLCIIRENQEVTNIYFFLLFLFCTFLSSYLYLNQSAGSSTK
eukprot:TRINITY_DN3174_c3_g1_i8.p1 TRINITY_DN3174_c3_g1~~TRINITY_DN3174_c3_g1_i8.p1  ORF type:complete len:155 (-),score=28.11 TRINITY_DN3174_c3_g1_i8:410-874(-)